ncbi:hypothetical protein [Shinella zoogloeoides]|uniref:hypothetical protein n=1 Tax=Shinella zoogloeoides TaxID=352475 RepID=UPI00299CE376|nr:hypothetical protein [Shinella zoogloeoides]WPE19928.1 hypothetical protein ShzoTeo12_11050 [Shinella zoogloeoides]
MASKKGNYPIPFTAAGDQLHCPEFQWVDGKRVQPEMKDNFVFEDTLKFDDMARGRSAAYFYFTRSSGTKVVVFMKDLCEMMPHLVGGVIKGKFTFTKRGQNYGTIFIGA